MVYNLCNLLSHHQGPQPSRLFLLQHPLRSFSRCRHQSNFMLARTHFLFQLRIHRGLYPHLIRTHNCLKHILNSKICKTCKTRNKLKTYLHNYSLVFNSFWLPQWSKCLRNSHQLLQIVEHHSHLYRLNPVRSLRLLSNQTNRFQILQKRCILPFLRQHLPSKRAERDKRLSLYCPFHHQNDSNSSSSSSSKTATTSNRRI